MNSSIMKEIVDSFPANSYHPKGLWTKNPHYQTIIGSGALSSMFLSDAKRPFESLPERIKTPDGDFFDIEFVGDFVDAKAIVVLVHGMESTMKGYQTTKQAIAMLEKGFCCCLYSFRGCNGEAPR